MLMASKLVTRPWRWRRPPAAIITTPPTARATATGPAPKPGRQGTKAHDATRSVFIDLIKEGATLLKGVFFRKQRYTSMKLVAPYFGLHFRRRGIGGTIVAGAKKIFIKPFGNTVRKQVLSAADAASEYMRKWVDKEGILRSGAP